MTHITHRLFLQAFPVEIIHTLGNLKIGFQNQKKIFLQKKLEIQAIFL